MSERVTIDGKVVRVSPIDDMITIQTERGALVVMLDGSHKCADYEIGETYPFSGEIFSRRHITAEAMRTRKGWSGWHDLLIQGDTSP